MQAKRIESGLGLEVPRQAKKGDAGYDLRSTIDTILKPGQHVTVDCGFAFAIPEGHVGLVIPRSGVGATYGLRLRNTVGVIDSGYRGPVKMCIENCGIVDYVMRRGDALAQLVVVPFYSGAVEIVPELGATERGANGFGSTGS